MELIQWLIDADKWLFTCINTGLSNPLFDAILPFFREKWFWAPLYLFVATYAVLQRGRQGWLLLAGLALVIALSDQVSSTLIKKNVQRLRPCNDPAMESVIVKRVPCGGGYSFTSSHASNHFAAAVFLVCVFGLARRPAAYALYAWAGAIAFSQVYVGVHYPLDVSCGALLGCGIGWAVWRAGQKWLAGDTPSV